MNRGRREGGSEWKRGKWEGERAGEDGDGGGEWAAARVGTPKEGAVVDTGQCFVRLQDRMTRLGRGSRRWSASTLRIRMGRLHSPYLLRCLRVSHNTHTCYLKASAGGGHRTPTGIAQCTRTHDKLLLRNGHSISHIFAVSIPGIARHTRR